MGNFPKGLTHDFGQKFQLYSLLFLLKIGPEMMFCDVLGRKEAFLDNKNMYFQDFRQKLELSSKCMLYVRKIGNFPKGLTHNFGQKFQLSSLFVLLTKRPRNDVWGCSRKKRSLSRQ